MRTEPTPEGRERGKHPAPGSLPLTGQDRGASEPQGEAQQLDWGEGEAEREPHRPRLPPGHHSPRRLQGAGAETRARRRPVPGRGPGWPHRDRPGEAGRAHTAGGAWEAAWAPGRRQGPLLGRAWEEDGTTTGTPCSAGTRALGGQVQTTTAILDSEGGATSQGHCHCPGTSHQEPAAPASPEVLTTARGLASRSPSSLEAPTGREPAHPLSRG